MRLSKKLRQFGSQASHFLFKRLTVIFLFLNANIASRRENVILLCDVLRSNNRAEAFFIFKRSFYKGVVGVGNFLDVYIRQFAQLPASSPDT